MYSSENPIRVSKPRHALFYGIYLLILVVSCVAVAEVLLRARGVQPWKEPEVSIKVVPGGKFFQVHPVLGYSHIPGRFTVTLSSGYSFDVTHLPNSLRVTRPIHGGTAPEHRKEIWIFGGSFTYGWSLNDEETYPWLLQEYFPEYDVTNFGVNGYGTVHALLQFQAALETRTPKVAVVAYADFHDERNTFSRTRRKNIAHLKEFGPLVQPYARLDEGGGLQFFSAGVEYSEFPAMRISALAHSLEMKFNLIEFKRHRSRTVSELLVAEMAGLAEKHGVKFVVANIAGNHVLKDFSEKNGIPNIDVSVDAGLPENTNRPHDDHPSAIANRKYAAQLREFLRSEILELDSCDRAETTNARQADPAENDSIALNPVPGPQNRGCE
jgi:hypothetical protein